MRKQFLKELVEEEGDQTQDQQPDNSNQPSIVVPKDPEQQKKAVQRFLYFINSIRLMMNKYTKTEEKLQSAIKADPEWQPTQTENQDTENNSQEEGQPEERKGLAAAKEKYKSYKEGAEKVVRTLEDYKKVFADVAKQLDSFYGTIKEAPQIDIKTVIAFLQTYQNKTEFAKFEGEAIYPNGPTLKQIMDVYKFLNQELKKQKEIIKILTPFVGEEDKVSSDQIGPMKTTDEISDEQQSEIIKKIDNSITNPEEIIKFIKSIRKGTVTEDLMRTLGNFYRSARQITGGLGTNYQSIFDNIEDNIPKNVTKVKTAKDLQSYLSFINDNQPDPIDPNITPDTNDIEFPRSIPEPTSSGDNLEEQVTTNSKIEKLKDFVKNTWFIETSQLYSPKFRETINLIDKKMKEYYSDGYEKSNSFQRLYDIANKVLPEDSEVEAKIIQLIDLNKLFSNKIKVPDLLKPEMIQMVLLPSSKTKQVGTPDTGDSRIRQVGESNNLFERLIKQELKVLNGKKMVRN